MQHEDPGMVKSPHRAPTQPPVRSPAPSQDAELLDLVHRGDVGRVRGYFDQALTGLSVTRPSWQHLRVALEARNVSMARLLVTWGARPASGDLQAYIAERGEQAPHDIACLRLAGLNLHDVSLPTPPSTGPTSAPSLPSPTAVPDPTADLAGKIPQEWITVLKAFHEQGAPEALIAGGALRDLCNGREVKDVDIFLADRFLSKRLLKRVFASANLAINDQIVFDSDDGYGAWKQMTHAHGAAEAFNTVTQVLRRDEYGAIFEDKKIAKGAEAWVIVAGPAKTSYNIVFIKGALGKQMRQAASMLMQKNAARLLMARFDLGLCQISYDGRAIYTLKAFGNDVRNKTMTLVRPNHASKEHLERVMKKYSDFTLCQDAQHLLDPAGTRTKKARAINGYTHVQAAIHQTKRVRKL